MEEEGGKNVIGRMFWVGRQSCRPGETDLKQVSIRLLTRGVVMLSSLYLVVSAAAALLGTNAAFPFPPILILM